MKKRIILVSVLVIFYIDLLAVGGIHGNLNSSTYTGTDNGEVCVYCHTPHGTGGTTAPLWNKPASTTAFTMYGAISSGVSGVTLAGTPTDAVPTDASMACLGCHDGVSAMNSVINAPGSGNYNTSGVLIGAYVSWGTYPKSMGATGNSAAVGAGGDMTDDHPISIKYIQGRAGLKDVNTPTADILGANKISDLLRNGKVQCVSCHDPHGTIYNMYLRSHNTNSALCLTCHAK